MAIAHKRWNPEQKLRFDDEFTMKINGRTITGTITKISPEEAENLLETSVGNRGTKTHSLNRLIQDMRRDEYYPHLLDPIRVSTEGELLDGHHRLEAIKQSGVSQILLCLSGYTMDDMVVFDQNKPRTLTDNMKIQGKDYTSKRASVQKWIYTILTNGEGGYAKGINRVIVPGNKDGQRISDFFSEDEWKFQLSWYNSRVAKNSYGLSAGPIITTKFLYDIANPGVSQDFWDGVFLGKDNAYLTKNDPRNALHTKFLAMSKLDDPNSYLKDDRYYLIKLIHYAWMKFEAGKPLQRMTAAKHVYDKAWEDLRSLTEKHFDIDFGQKNYF